MCQDPDMVRWGLHLLHLGPSLDCSENGNINQNCIRGPDMQHADEVSCTIDGISVENDEIIAHALQEELSQVAIAEASGNSHAAEEQLQASVLSQRWYDNKPNSGMLPVDLVVEDTESSSLPNVGLREGEDHLIELVDDFSALDGEVCKRLNQITPVPHIPKINGEIPTEDEATSYHQRLLDRLKVYDLVEQKVQGDGNCQFRALSDQFYRTPEYHKFVRTQVIKQLKSNPEIYEGYVPMPYHDYIKKMSKSGEWGDHVTLQAAADSYGVRIFILTSFKDTCYIEILPNVQKTNRVIHLSFWAEVHYNSIYPEGEFPLAEFGKKKRWWQLFFY